MKKNAISQMKRTLSLLFFTLLIGACSTTPPIEEGTVEEGVVGEESAAGSKNGVFFKREAFSLLPTSQDSDWDVALRAFKLSCTKMGDAAPWREVCLKAQMPQVSARAFFEENFDPWKVKTVASNGKESETGLMTGYYEPVLEGSRHKTERFSVPLYSPPDDLLTVSLASTYPALKGMPLKGKLKGKRIVPYDTREAIMGRRDLERYAICWVENPVEAFFLEVQGSGRIHLQDGAEIRLGFADSNGHPYRAIAKWLVERGEIKPAEASMQRILEWAKKNPERTKEMLSYNKRYIFFKERSAAGSETGPVGSLGVPLTARASVAVDKRYWQLGIPFVVQVNQDNPPMHFVRPVVSQDTGTAIRGAMRFDYFWGSGAVAAKYAGSQKSPFSAWVLFPKDVNPWEF